MVKLPGSLYETSRIGFGCAFLVGGASERESARLVEAAFDGGIRHFDVAPSYGLGLAENVIGATLGSRKDRVTITTKVGVPRPQWGYSLSVVRATVRPVTQRLRSLRSASAQIGGGLVSGRQELSPAVIEQSLKDSLRRLKADRVDALLLHERVPHEVGPEIVDALESLMSSGWIGSYGLGVAGFADSDLFERPIGKVVQFASSIFSDFPMGGVGQLKITHRAMLNGRLKLATALSDDADFERMVRELIDFDPADEERTADLLLAAALHENENGIVLVSSSKIARITRYAQIPFDKQLMAAGRLIRAYFGARRTKESGGLEQNEGDWRVTDSKHTSCEHA